MLHFFDHNKALFGKILTPLNQLAFTAEKKIATDLATVERIGSGMKRMAPNLTNVLPLIT